MLKSLQKSSFNFPFHEEIASHNRKTSLRDTASMNFVDLHSKKSDEHVIQTESYLLIFDLKGTNGEHKNTRPVLKIEQEPKYLLRIQ